MVVATYTINDKRKERISFAGPYYIAGQDIMVLKDNPKDITGPDSFKTNGAKVCSVQGSTPSENIKQYLGTPDQLVLFDVYLKCADALRTGQVDAVVLLPHGRRALADDADDVDLLRGDLPDLLAELDPLLLRHAERLLPLLHQLLHPGLGLLPCVPAEWNHFA